MGPEAEPIAGCEMANTGDEADDDVFRLALGG